RRSRRIRNPAAAAAVKSENERERVRMKSGMRVLILR
ncbi:hypothetical protein A2U01_0066985, partial [Trifolium medium]|nr:hypothetical protein [Trifolium medium]